MDNRETNDKYKNIIMQSFIGNKAVVNPDDLENSDYLADTPAHLKKAAFKPPNTQM